YDPSAKVPFRQVAYTKGSAQPRLAVALDYMHLSKVERVLHWEHAKGNSFFMVVGPKTHRLACIAGVRLWGFGKTRNPPGETTWIPFDTVLKFRYVARGSAFESPVAAPQSGIYEMTLPAGRQAEITMLQAAKTTRWFCEVTLQAPKGLPVEHFKLDSWFFPVDFTTRKTGIELVPMLCRRVGEQGEVPDWKWLNTTFRERYLDPKIATHVDK
ncbi:hypothetical protein ACIP1U_28915, partial [Cupriavidus sp. NPDC089707]|uniref:hypothetical protein n=1 Tax=Cupriavidus sp. NPDC089707 TaxID=3363963 RepID=UPI00382638D3